MASTTLTHIWHMLCQPRLECGSDCVPLFIAGQTQHPNRTLAFASLPHWFESVSSDSRHWRTAVAATAAKLRQILAIISWILRESLGIRAKSELLFDMKGKHTFCWALTSFGMDNQSIKSLFSNTILISSFGCHSLTSTQSEGWAQGGDRQPEITLSINFSEPLIPH